MRSTKGYDQKDVVEREKHTCGLR